MTHGCGPMLTRYTVNGRGQSQHTHAVMMVTTSPATIDTVVTLMEAAFTRK